MAAPSKSFVVLPDADTDPDSPVTTDLITALRDNDQNVFAQLVGEPVSSPPFTPAQAHDHDGTNSKQISTTLQHIETKEIAASVQSVTFTGLNGDADKFYLLKLRIRMNSTGISNPYQLRINGSAAAADIFTILPAITGTNGIAAGRVTLWTPATVQATGMRRYVLAEAVSGSHAFPIQSEYPGVWEDTTTNITSLQVFGSGAVTPALLIATGSSLSLYKLKEG